MTPNLSISLSEAHKIEKDKLFSNVKYKCFKRNTSIKLSKSIDVIGLDTEAFQDGECYMICTSEGDVYKREEFPSCFFGRKYRNKNFVVWNLKYDSGALLQLLPFEILEQIRQENIGVFNGYEYELIGYKRLRIRKISASGRKNAGITIFDIMGFYNMSLQKASEIYLNNSKHDVEIAEINRDNLQENWNTLVKYCIQDCVLTKKLAELQINSFEKMGIYTRSLISTAYISYQHFREVCNPPNMYYFWNYHKKVLDYAMKSYSGGKFEVTEKGLDDYYCYDIVSAYPFEITKLPDLKNVKVEYSVRFSDEADFSFLDCEIDIPVSVNNPSSIKKKGLCVYPVGVIRKVITGIEYKYFVRNGCYVKIFDCVNVYCKEHNYLFADEIHRLMEYKAKYKEEKNDSMYNTTKVLLNSLYGKFVQLIWKNGCWNAGDSWNPLYASYITAGCRVRITDYQNKYNSVVAVHTDSLISKEKLKIPKTKKLGVMSYEYEGSGVIVGSGVYQIGDKTKLRGFDSKLKLIDLIDTNSSVINFDAVKFQSWKETIFRGHSPEEINAINHIQKTMSIDFDHKRTWIDDYKTFSEIRERKVYSAPYFYF